MSSPWKKQTPQKNDGEQGELVPEGNQAAVCVALIDIGTHTNEYQGKTTTARKVFIVWELVEEQNRPCIGKDFTFSFHEKALLRDTLKKWRNGTDLAEGEEFDISVLLGKPCNLVVAHKTANSGKVFAKVDGVTGLVKSQVGKVGKPSREPFLWSVSDGDITDIPDWIPWLYGQSIPDHVQKCAEYQEDGDGGDADEGEVPDPATTAPAGGPTPF